MISRYFLAFLCCIGAGPAVAAKLDACPSLAKGNWTITGISTPDQAVAMSREEARSFIGKRVSISERQLAFAPRRCKIAEITVHYVPDEWYAMPGLPYFVDIDCTTDMEVPAFLTGKSCNRMVGILDGWTLDMRRAR